MKYLLVTYGNAEFWASLGAAAAAASIAAQEAFNQEFFDSGELLAMAGLADAENAKVVRTRAGSPVVSDGPYQQAREQLGSYCVLDCESEQRALEIAARMPFAAVREVEVWPLMGLAGLEM